MKDELKRRASCAQQLEWLLKSRAGEWIPIRELAEAGGIGGWRTRLSELGLRKVNPLHIEHNGQNGAESCHRYLDHVPLGRDPQTPDPVGWPVPDAPYADTFRLT